MKLRALVLRVALAACTVIALPALTACAPLLVAAVGGGVLVAADRRSAGAQLDDQSIEFKIAAAASSRFGDKLHLNVTSYNGIVLLSGEVPDQKAMTGIVNLARTTDRVRNVQNELVVAPPSSFGDRANDSLITSKIKARFVEANEFPANHVKVVTERRVVYLMGLVSRQEADAASRVAASTSGVLRVVRLFEYLA